MKKNEKSQLIKEAFIESWVGFISLGAFLYVSLLTDNTILSGLFAVLSAVLFMNGFAKTSLILTAQGPLWWREHKTIKWMHFASEEGELSGIFIGVVFVCAILIKDSNAHVHFPIAAALTLVGIMSAANMAIKNVIPIMAYCEQKLGTHIALFIGALLSALTGAAASVFVCEYFKNKIMPNKQSEFATKFAAALSLGNGLLPYASPPVLIIWGLLQSKLGWSVLTLLLFIGIPAIIYALLLTLYAARVVLNEHRIINYEDKAKYPLFILVFIVAINIISYDSIYVMGLNACIGLAATINSNDFHVKYGAWILGLLIIALEIIGIEANDFISWVAITLIPEGVSVLLLGFILFYITAFISHFADNALASKLVITAAVATPAFTIYGDFLASAVLLGALAGGFALIPANLPNFPIARILKISPNEWSKAALKIYPSMFLFFIALTIIYFLKDVS